MGHLVYEYGIQRITAGQEELVQQLFARHRYWNSLVEIEQSYQKAKEAIVSQANAEVEQARAAYDAAVQAVEAAVEARNQARAQSRTRQTPAESAAVSAARQSRKEAYQAYKEVRAAAFDDPAVKDALSEAGRQRTAQVREARAATELYWGSYLDVENNYKAQRRTKGSRLKFHRPVPEGTVSVWLLDGGIPTEKVWGESSMVQLDPAPRGDQDRRVAEAWSSPRRSDRVRLSRTTGRLRVGTGPDKRPVYVEFQVAVHRPLPPDGVVRHASIVRRRVAGGYEHTLNITVETAEVTADREVPGVAGIDIGWRVFPDRVRIGYLADDRGRVEELSIPLRLVTAMEKVQDLRSIRDHLFNGARSSLVAWKGERISEMPQWFLDRTETLPHWHSPGRLAALERDWRDQRFPGDETAYANLRAWRDRDKHLWEYEANLRHSTIRRRREKYRVLAARLCQRYGRLVLEEFDLSQVAQQEDQPEAAQQHRFYVAVGEFRRILATTAAREGVAVQKVPAEYTTLTCHRCERRCDFNALQEVSHRCEWCGTRWDQDENAARNLLRAGRKEEPLAVGA